MKKLLLLFSKPNKKHSRSQFLFLQARKNSFSRKRVSLSAQNKFGRLVWDNATFLSLASRFWHKAKRKGEPYKQHNQFVPFFFFPREAAQITVSLRTFNQQQFVRRKKRSHLNKGFVANWSSLNNVAQRKFFSPESKR